MKNRSKLIAKRFKRKARILSWKPVRRGNIYCSPACGNGCTIQEYRKAVIDANALAAKLGSKWKPIVKENLRWFAEARSEHGHLRVSAPYFGEKYSAIIGDAYGVTIDYSDSDKDPKVAVRKVLKVARVELMKSMQKYFDLWPGAMTRLELSKHITRVELMCEQITRRDK